MWREDSTHYGTLLMKAVEFVNYNKQATAQFSDDGRDGTPQQLIHDLLEDQ